MREEHGNNDVTANNQASEKLYEAITNIDDGMVEQASDYTFSNNLNKKKESKDLSAKTTSRMRTIKRIILAMAASVCLVFGIGFLFIWGPAGGGGSGDTGTSYMSYAGPVFPLTTTFDTTGIEVSRHTNWDFSPYESEIITEKMHEDIPENTETYTYDKYETESIVTDSYVLTNKTDVAITLSVLYPFSAKFSDPIKTVAQISVNGVAIEPDYFAGKYSGSYAPALGDTDSEEKLNLDSISNWNEYKALLSNGSYLSDAQKEFPSLDIPIIVYEYANLTYVGDDEASNPTFGIHFKHDSTKTTLTGWGWNAGGWEGDGSGYYGCSRVYVPGGNDIDKGATAYLIVIGEDIEAPIIQGYKDGGCDDGEEINNVTTDFKKYETTLEDFIVNICFAEFESTSEYLYGTDVSDDTTLLSLVTKEMALGYIAQLMYDDGILSGDGIERYDSGWLENYVYDYPQMSRVMYLSFDVTIPAGSSITVDASMIKDASFDYIGKNKDRNGYDMVTTLASPFTFTKQTASITNSEFIEIIDQNFGFDLQNGITEVELDLTEEHYWMDIRKKSTE